MLKWFVDAKVVDAVLQKSKFPLIEEEQVEVCPENLPDAVLDENVDIHLIRRYFTNDAWLLLKDVVKQKISNTYSCKTCSHDLDEAESIVCDHCLSWYHVKCTGLKSVPKQKHWYCRRCHQSPFE